VDKEQFLLKELDKKIKVFKDESTKHKDIHRQFRVAAYIFTGVLSVLAGLALYLPDQHTSLINISILLISASAAACNSWEGLRKSDELWIHERTIFYTLTDLKRELEFDLQGSGAGEDVLKKAFIRFQAILSNSGDKWSGDIVGGKDTG